MSTRVSPPTIIHEHVRKAELFSGKWQASRAENDHDNALKYARRMMQSAEQSNKTSLHMDSFRFYSISLLDREEIFAACMHLLRALDLYYQACAPKEATVSLQYIHQTLASAFASLHLDTPDDSSQKDPKSNFSFPGVSEEEATVWSLQHAITAVTLASEISSNPDIYATQFEDPRAPRPEIDTMISQAYFALAESLVTLGALSLARDVLFDQKYVDTLVNMLHSTKHGRQMKVLEILFNTNEI